MNAKAEIARFGVDLALLKAKAMRLGLWQTFHAIDEATKAYVKDFTNTDGLGLLSEPKPKKRKR